MSGSTNSLAQSLCAWRNEWIDINFEIFSLKIIDIFSGFTFKCFILPNHTLFWAWKSIETSDFYIFFNTLKARFQQKDNSGIFH